MLLPFGSAPTPSATSSKLGKIKLTNDLGGTALLPTVVATHLSSALPLAQGGTGSTSLTTGGVLFSNGTIITSDATKFFWDNTAKWLGINTTSQSIDGGNKLELKGVGGVASGNSYLVATDSSAARQLYMGVTSSAAFMGAFLNHSFTLRANNTDIATVATTGMSITGTCDATTYNKVTITAPATSATLTLANSSSLITSGGNSITLTSTGTTNVTLPTSGTLTRTADKLSVFAATSSSELAGVISDETGSGALVFAAAPTLTGNVSVTGASQLTFEGPSGDTGNLNVVMDTYYTNVLGTRFIGRHSRGSKASPTATASGDELFGVEGRGHTGSGFLGNASAGFFLLAEEAFTTSKSGSSVIIQATDLGTNSRDTIMKVKGNYSVIITGRLGCNLTGVGSSAGTGAGTGPTLTPSGSDMAGSIQVLTGTLPAASAAIVTVTFVKTFDSNPTVVFSPANAITASLAAASQIYVTSSTTGFTLNSNTVALAATTTYKWNYMVIQ